MENNKLIFKHGCFSGDLIYALAGIKAICGNAHKAIIYQWLDQYGHLYEGANHPYGGSMMPRSVFDQMKPLLMRQGYIESFEVWQGEKVMVDLDQIRRVKMHMPYGSITRWPAMAYAELAPRDWEPWLECDPDPLYDGVILVNRTSRYHGAFIDYFHLRKHQERVVFIGLESEYKAFKADWGLEISHIQLPDFLSLARAIKSCKLFIGNQSMCFAIAEGLKSPRLLEVCDFAPNVIPNGPNGHYFRAPETFEYLVEKLINQ